MERLEEGGLWWLPEAPSAQVPGVLRVETDGKASLTLIGQLRDYRHGADRTELPDGSTKFSMTMAGQATAGRYPRVVGRIGGESYTLEAGIRTRHSTLMQRPCE